MTNEQKEKILGFIRTQNLAVVSTTDGHKPESALVAFAETENLELIFGTSDATRKYYNLRKNNLVSFVIGLGSSDARITIQYEGTATELAGEDARACSSIHIAKNPGSAQYLNDPHQRYFIVKPGWIRYADYSKEPNDIFELSIF